MDGWAWLERCAKEGLGSADRGPRCTINRAVIKGWINEWEIVTRRLVYSLINGAVIDRGRHWSLFSGPRCRPPGGVEGGRGPAVPECGSVGSLGGNGFVGGRREAVKWIHASSHTQTLFIRGGGGSFGSETHPPKKKSGPKFG